MLYGLWRAYIIWASMHLLWSFPPSVRQPPFLFLDKGCWRSLLLKMGLHVCTRTERIKQGVSGVFFFYETKLRVRERSGHDELHLFTALVRDGWDEGILTLLTLWNRVCC